MIFSPLTKEDAKPIGAVLAEYGAKLCDYSFLSLYMWADVYETVWAREEGLLFLRSRDPHTGELFYTIPHRGEAFHRGLDLLCAAAPGRLLLWGLPEDVCPAVREHFGERVHFTSNEEESDYLYEIADLAEMRGRRFSAKRNHIHAFLREHPDYALSPLTAENLPAVRAFYEAYRQSEEDDSQTARDEGRAVWRILDDYLDLPAEGGVLTSDGRILGFFIGEVVGETLFLHVEKALREVRGAYPVMVQAAAARFLDRVRYENREEDDGDEGLRQSKRSYCPVALLEKFTAEVDG